MNGELVKVIKNTKGKIITIGVSEKSVINAIHRNDKIINCFELNNNNIENKKVEFTKRIFSKNVTINNFKKKFKKKKTDLILVNIKHIEEYIFKFSKDSIYLSKGQVIYYGSAKDIDRVNVESYYDRFNVVVNKDVFNKNKIVTIEVYKYKYKVIKEFIYTIKYYFNKFIDSVGNFLVG